MSSEGKILRALLAELECAPVCRFPAPGERHSAPTTKGIYVIYSSRMKVLHVGATPRGNRGLCQRLANHLHGKSSFTKNSLWLKRRGHSLLERCGYLREHGKYRCLEVKDHRLRALLEAYAIGCLCPEHLGLGQAVD